MMLNVAVAKIGETWSAEVEDLPATSIAYLLSNGAKQSVNDSHSAVKSSDYATLELYYDAVRAKAEKRWNQILSGEVPGTKAPADASTASVRRVVKAVGKLSPEEEAMVTEVILQARAKAA